MEYVFSLKQITVFSFQVLCSICGYNGVVKKTKKAPGFVCLCQRGFYGDRCEHHGKFTYLIIIMLLLFFCYSYHYYHYNFHHYHYHHHHHHHRHSRHRHRRKKKQTKKTYFRIRFLFVLDLFTLFYLKKLNFPLIKYK